jgi:hypothetical protein
VGGWMCASWVSGRRCVVAVVGVLPFVREVGSNSR